MDKAIEILESIFETRETGTYILQSVSKQDVDEALAEPQAYKAKFQELEAKYNQLTHNHDLDCHENCQNLCWENEESYCKEEGCIRNYIDPSLYIDIYEDKYKTRELDK